jgi:hypothetical protein
MFQTLLPKKLKRVVFSLICLSISLASTRGQLISTFDETADIQSFQNRQLIDGFGATPGFWLGAFDDVGQDSQGNPIPAGTTNIWTPTRYFSPETSGALGTVILPLNTAGLVGLRLEIWTTPSGAYSANTNNYQLVDSTEIDGVDIASGKSFVSFDFGADTYLNAGQDYIAQLSLVQTTTKDIWQAAYWMTPGGAPTSVGANYTRGFGEFEDIPTSLRSAGIPWSVFGDPGLRILETSQLSAIPEPATLGLLGLILLPGYFLYRRGRNR